MDKPRIIDGDDLIVLYERIQKEIDLLRECMILTRRRYPHQTGWDPALDKLTALEGALRICQGK